MADKVLTPDGYDSEVGWTDNAVRDEIKGLVFTSAAQAVAVILAVLDRHGYDSIDRELSFTIASHRLGIPYEDLYDAWIGDCQLPVSLFVLPATGVNSVRKADG